MEFWPPISNLLLNFAFPIECLIILVITIRLRRRFWIASTVLLGIELGLFAYLGYQASICSGIVCGLGPLIIALFFGVALQIIATVLAFIQPGPRLLPSALQGISIAAGLVILAFALILGSSVLAGYTSF